MAKGFKCSKCDRSFSMAAHLARHKNTIHAPAGHRKAAKKTTKKRAKKRAKVGRRGSAGRRRRVGRPSGLTTRLGLRDMDLQQLAAVIEAARAEGRQRIQELQQAF